MKSALSHRENTSKNLYSKSADSSLILNPSSDYTSGRLEVLQRVADLSTVTKHLSNFQIIADQHVAAPLQFAAGAAERENDAKSIRETWSKEEEDFVWKVGDKYFKRKKKDQTGQMPPDDLNPSDIVEATKANDANFTFDTSVDQGNEALSLVTIDQVAPGKITQLNPKGEAVRNFLHEDCHQSWHIALEHLNRDGPNNDKKENRRNMLRKIWEYRQWHHDYILHLTQAELGSDKLTEWAAAGSSSLTSDIDVNLKGTDTQEAVKTFNRLFKADGWNYEAGIVYDVNVYALDFMHKEFIFGKGMVEKKSRGIIEETQDLHGNVLKKENTVTGKTVMNNTGRVKGLAAKEGARSGLAEGGYDGTNIDIIAADAKDQDIWTHVKTRLYMNPAEWNAHCTAIEMSQETKAKVDARFLNYTQTLKNKMLALSPVSRVETEIDASDLGINELEKFALGATPKKGGAMANEIQHTESSDLIMQASNRVYEEKLQLIKQLRATLKNQIAQYDAILNSNFGHVPEDKKEEAKLINSAIEMNLQLLRNLLAEASLYANEAYITDGAVNHAVVGTQIGLKIRQKKSESKNAVVENLADTLKEISRHGDTLGEAAFKSGKYLYRLTDAAQNMGYSSNVVTAANKASHKISTKIKSSVPSLAAQKAQSEVQLKKVPGWKDIASADNYKDKIRSMAQDIIKWYKSQGPGFGAQQSAAVGTHKPVET